MTGQYLQSRYFYGYNIVAAGFLIQATAIGMMFTYGVFFKEFQAAFGWSRALIAGASSTAFLIMGLGAVITGILNDRIGPRIILTVSGALLGIGYIFMSRLQVPWQLFFWYGVLVGIGFATHDVITLSTVARWFNRRRGTMTGLVKVGTGAGQFTVPLIATYLIAVLGWRQAYFVIGAVAFILLVAAAQLMKRDPQELGLQPDGDVFQKKTSSKQLPSLTLLKAVRTIAFWTICLAEFAIFFCLLTTIVHIVPHARDLGLAPTSAAAVLATIGGISMVGRMIMGIANDRIGGKRSLILCFIILILSFVWLLGASNAWMLFLFAVLYGFAHGGLFTVMSPTVAELFGTGSHGSLFGTILFSGTLGGSVGPYLAGAIFDATGSYRSAFIALLILAMAGLALILALRIPTKRGDLYPA